MTGGPVRRPDSSGEGDPTRIRECETLAELAGAPARAGISQFRRIPDLSRRLDYPSLAIAGALAFLCPILFPQPDSWLTLARENGSLLGRDRLTEITGLPRVRAD
ncbi:MAG: hypothetical protein ACXWN0_17990, partial [Isosphaeraceae bacterium]